MGLAQRQLYSGGNVAMGNEEKLRKDAMEGRILWLK